MRVRLRNNLGDVSVCWFQFTHPCGCDAKVKPTNKSVESFNSRTRVGATQISRKNNTMKEFQFTHPCGCDFHFVHHYGVDSCFNSRTRVGATVSNRTARLIPQVSIHAPVWVRLYCVGKMKALHRFQFTHPCGCDRVFRERAVQYYGFNSRTRVGATRLNCRTSKGNRFQFTHSLRSATLASFGLKLFHVVSIHALLAECD